MYKYYKSEKDETEADINYGFFRTWSDEAHRLGQEIQVKLKAVRKYESPKKIDELKIKDKKE